MWFKHLHLYRVHDAPDLDIEPSERLATQAFRPLGGVEARFKPAGGKFERHMSKLTSHQREAFLINNLSDCDHYYVDIGETVAELVAAATAEA